MIENIGKYSMILSGVILVIFGSAFFAQEFSILGDERTNQDSGEIDDWRNVTLERASTGEKYKLSELDNPLIVETFAVWCPTCTRQQQEVKKLHQQSNVTSVSLNVDPNEGVEKIMQHKRRYGFDWRYSVAPVEMTDSLVNKFGTSILNPPRAPMILVCENSSRKLQNGVKPASKISEEIEKGC